MKGNFLKRLLPAILIVMMLCVVAMPVASFASDKNNPEYWKGLVDENTTDGVGKKVDNLGKQIVGIIQIVGNLVAIGFLIWLGVKWIMASAQEKADLKKNMWNYVLGAIILFGASNIIPVVVNFATTL